MKRTQWRSVGAALFVWGAAGTALTGAQAPMPAADATEPAEAAAASDRVTLSVEDGEISQVLTAFSRQTGRNIVIGPDVKGSITARVSNESWQTALDVILRPYGFTYSVVGDTVLVTKFDPAAVALPDPPDPLVARVFELKYLDASDVEEVLQPHLTERGSIMVLRPLGQYWEPESSIGGGSGGMASQSGPDTTLARGRRTQEDRKVARSKRFIVRDTETTLHEIEALVLVLDIAPRQVLIEARFIELNSDLLRDIGVEFGSSAQYRTGGNVQRVAGGVRTLDAAPQILPADAPFNTVQPFNTGGQLLFQQLTDIQFSVLLNMLEDERGANVLSSPRIMTLNNQEARIIVGEKFPILTYQNTATAGAAGLVTETSLDYYEKIGIQLAVVPQICDGNRINMTVRPSVTDRTSLVETYPVLSTREAETQILVNNGETVVIGGLVRERDRNEQYRVPFFGQIPLLGWLFKRDVTMKEKVDLLIFLTATIHEPGPMDAAAAAAYSKP